MTYPRVEDKWFSPIWDIRTSVDVASIFDLSKGISTFYLRPEDKYYCMNRVVDSVELIFESKIKGSETEVSRCVNHRIPCIGFLIVYLHFIFDSKIILSASLRRYQGTTELILESRITQPTPS